MIREYSTAINPKRVIERGSMWQFLNDTKLIQKGYPLAELDRAYAKEFKDDQLFGFRYHNPHDSHEQFIFHDFLEFLILVADHVYHDSPTLSIHEHGLAASLSYMIKNDVIPNVTPLLEVQITALSKFERYIQIVRNTFEQDFGMQIESMYHDLARKHAKALRGSSKDKTLSIREFIFMLKNYGLLGSDVDDITIPFVIEEYAKIIPLVIDNCSYNLEYEPASRKECVGRS
eukprot:jgi/Hompol1/6720/HPOL_002319-RA